MNITIVNQHTNNFGDDAAGHALVHALVEKFNPKTINIIYNAGNGIDFDEKCVRNRLDLSLKRIGRFHLFLYFFLRLFKIRYRGNATIRAYFETIEQSDYVFVAPSGANIGIYKDWRLLIRLLFVIDAGKTPIFHLNTIGKSGNRIFDNLALKILKKSILFVREHKSFDYLTSIGLAPTFGTDTAFLLKTLTVKKTGYIAFIPSELDSWHPAFRKNKVNNFVATEMIRAISEYLIQSNKHIVIIPHLRNEIENRFINEIIKNLYDYGVDKSSVVYRSDINNYVEYDSLIAGSDFVIGMRYHSIVLAAKNCVPFVSIGYENKMKEVANYCDMGHYHLDLANRSNDWIFMFKSLLQEIDKNSPTIIRHLNDKIVEVKAQASVVINSIGGDTDE